LLISLDLLRIAFYLVSMYVERVPNRGSRPSVLLRESFREGARVRKRTLANLTHWPQAQVEALRAVLGGATAVASLEEAFDVVQSRPHGHVRAVLGTLRKLGLERMLAPRRGPERDRVVAMIVARLLAPASKLATARGLDAETAVTTLGETLDRGAVRAEDLYAALDWLLARQGRIEQALAKGHLHEGTLVLYDVSSTYFEGRCCPLAKIGHSRDGKKGTLQIVFGLLCNAEGCPVAVEVYEGNTGDPTTLHDQITKVRQRFGLDRVVFVGDRGLLTNARIREEFAPVPGLDWISALRASQIQALAEAGGPLQPSLFDEQDLAEIRHPDYPRERLIACFNPFLADERARKREDLLRATERDLAPIAEATRRPKRALRGKDHIALRVGAVLGRFKMAKHFDIEITETSFHYARDEQAIAAEARLDGIYVIRTSLPAEALCAEGTVRAYKDLARVERAFRSLKTIDLHIRPIYHRLADRVRAHVFLCLLAYYVEWHMRRALAPILFDEDDPAGAEAERVSIVRPATRSPSAQAKARTQRTADGRPVHSFRTLLSDLATVTKTTIQPRIEGAPAFERLTRPSPLQQRAFDLLGVPLTP
jgi:hypothetical protein